MDVVLASGNENKLAEIRAILPSGFNLVSQKSLGVTNASETGLTFIENAIIKARHASSMTGLPAIADDSGLEVACLGGAPGIYSARYAGPAATDAENNEKLLQELNEVSPPERQARFQCVMVLLKHEFDPVPVIAQGTWQGEILKAPRGKNGFGYDPLFYVPDLDQTAAELDADTKNRLSHRGQALRALTLKLTD